ncbi:hypothetical protein IQ06DRAFT_379967 [Phaeosphaeriaceae sp. SRC1lsM3a]|nr:hypothetical protein IQ06DRAFT_379967 [Stagonospora sp. SRC1lsM3a]
MSFLAHVLNSLTRFLVTIASILAASHHKTRSHLLQHLASHREKNTHSFILHHTHIGLTIAPSKYQIQHIPHQLRPTSQTNTMQTRNTQATSGVKVAIIIAAILSGTVLAVASMLVIMCHVTNRRRRKEQKKEGMEMETRCEVGGVKGVEGDGKGVV